MRPLFRYSPLVIALGFAVALTLLPIATRTMNGLWLLSLGAVAGGLIWVGRKRRWVVGTGGAIALGLLLLAVLPGRSPDVARLRTRYVAALHAYEGSLYVWGGESRAGIDCSGLVRSAWMKANALEGIATRNPGLLRQAVVLWWRDASARELGEGYGGRTRLVGTADSLNYLCGDGNQSALVLLPGDLAVTADGLHVLAYAGEGAWVEADPIPLRVVRLQAPDAKNVWLDKSVRIMRWEVLANEGTD